MSDCSSDEEIFFGPITDRELQLRSKKGLDSLNKTVCDKSFHLTNSYIGDIESYQAGSNVTQRSYKKRRSVGINSSFSSDKSPNNDSKDDIDLLEEPETSNKSAEKNDEAVSVASSSLEHISQEFEDSETLYESTSDSFVYVKNNVHDSSHLPTDLPIKYDDVTIGNDQKCQAEGNESKESCIEIQIVERDRSVSEILSESVNEVLPATPQMNDCLKSEMLVDKMKTPEIHVSPKLKLSAPVEENQVTVQNIEESESLHITQDSEIEIVDTINKSVEVKSTTEIDNIDLEKIVSDFAEVNVVNVDSLNLQKNKSTDKANDSSGFIDCSIVSVSENNEIPSACDEESNKLRENGDESVEINMNSGEQDKIADNSAISDSLKEETCSIYQLENSIQVPCSINDIHDGDNVNVVDGELPSLHEGFSTNNEMERFEVPQGSISLLNDSMKEQEVSLTSSEFNESAEQFTVTDCNKSIGDTSFFQKFSCLTIEEKLPAEPICENYTSYMTQSIHEDENSFHESNGNISQQHDKSITVIENVENSIACNRQDAESFCEEQTEFTSINAYVEQKLCTNIVFNEADDEYVDDKLDSTNCEEQTSVILDEGEQDYLNESNPLENETAGVANESVSICNIPAGELDSSRTLSLDNYSVQDKSEITQNVVVDIVENTVDMAKNEICKGQEDGLVEVEITSEKTSVIQDFENSEVSTSICNSLEHHSETFSVSNTDNQALDLSVENIKDTFCATEIESVFVDEQTENLTLHNAAQLTVDTDAIDEFQGDSYLEDIVDKILEETVPSDENMNSTVNESITLKDVEDSHIHTEVGEEIMENEHLMDATENIVEETVPSDDEKLTTKTDDSEEQLPLTEFNKEVLEGSVSNAFDDGICDAFAENELLDISLKDPDENKNTSLCQSVILTESNEVELSECISSTETAGNITQEFDIENAENKETCEVANDFEISQGHEEISGTSISFTTEKQVLNLSTAVNDCSTTVKQMLNLSTAVNDCSTTENQMLNLSTAVNDCSTTETQMLNLSTAVNDCSTTESNDIVNNSGLFESAILNKSTESEACESIQEQKQDESVLSESNEAITSYEGLKDTTQEFVTELEQINDSVTVNAIEHIHETVKKTDISNIDKFYTDENVQEKDEIADQMMQSTFENDMHQLLDSTPSYFVENTAIGDEVLLQDEHSLHNLTDEFDDVAQDINCSELTVSNENEIVLQTTLNNTVSDHDLDVKNISHLTITDNKSILIKDDTNDSESRQDTCEVKEIENENICQINDTSLDQKPISLMEHRDNCSLMGHSISDGLSFLKNNESLNEGSVHKDFNFQNDVTIDDLTTIIKGFELRSNIFEEMEYCVEGTPSQIKNEKLKDNLESDSILKLNFSMANEVTITDASCFIQEQDLYIENENSVKEDCVCMETAEVKEVEHRDFLPDIIHTTNNDEDNKKEQVEDVVQQEKSTNENANYDIENSSFKSENKCDTQNQYIKASEDMVSGHKVFDYPSEIEINNGKSGFDDKIKIVEGVTVNEDMQNAEEMKIEVNKCSDNFAHTELKVVCGNQEQQKPEAVCNGIKIESASSENFENLMNSSGKINNTEIISEDKVPEIEADDNDAIVENGDQSKLEEKVNITDLETVTTPICNSFKGLNNLERDAQGELEDFGIIGSKGGYFSACKKMGANLSLSADLINFNSPLVIEETRDEDSKTKDESFHLPSQLVENSIENSTFKNVKGIDTSDVLFANESLFEQDNTCPTNHESSQTDNHLEPLSTSKENDFDCSKCSVAEKSLSCSIINSSDIDAAKAFCITATPIPKVESHVGKVSEDMLSASFVEKLACMGEKFLSSNDIKQTLNDSFELSGNTFTSINISSEDSQVLKEAIGSDSGILSNQLQHEQLNIESSQLSVIKCQENVNKIDLSSISNTCIVDETSFNEENILRKLHEMSIDESSINGPQDSSSKGETDENEDMEKAELAVPVNTPVKDDMINTTEQIMETDISDVLQKTPLVLKEEQDSLHQSLHEDVMNELKDHEIADIKGKVCNNSLNISTQLTPNQSCSSFVSPNLNSTSHLHENSFNIEEMSKLLNNSRNASRIEDEVISVDGNHSLSKSQDKKHDYSDALSLLPLSDIAEMEICSTKKQPPSSAKLFSSKKNAVDEQEIFTEVPLFNEEIKKKLFESEQELIEDERFSLIGKLDPILSRMSKSPMEVSSPVNTSPKKQQNTQETPISSMKETKPVRLNSALKKPIGTKTPAKLIASKENVPLKKNLQTPKEKSGSFVTRPFNPPRSCKKQKPLETAATPKNSVSFLKKPTSVSKSITKSKPDVEIKAKVTTPSRAASNNLSSGSAVKSSSKNRFGYCPDKNTGSNISKVVTPKKYRHVESPVGKYIQEMPPPLIQTVKSEKKATIPKTEEGPLKPQTITPWKGSQSDASVLPLAKYSLKPTKQIVKSTPAKSKPILKMQNTPVMTKHIGSSKVIDGQDSLNMDDSSLDTSSQRKSMLKTPRSFRSDMNTSEVREVDVARSYTLTRSARKMK